MTQELALPISADADTSGDELLRVSGLRIEFRTSDGWVEVVRDVGFTLRRGEILGLVGESGSGKSVTAQAILGLIGARGGRIADGSIVFAGRELTQLKKSELQSIRGSRIGMVFQQASSSLHPSFTAGEQIAEAVRRHRDVSRKEAWDHAVEMLDRVRIPDPERRAKQYPHEMSGGMCQRVMIASALALEPELLIADEPTTALDVTVQATILDLLRQLQEETGVAVLFITHDLGVIAELCESVVVMYAGQIVESATAEELFLRPRHPYSEGLLRSIPRPGGGRRLVAIPGRPPRPTEFPSGCRFRVRCSYADPIRCIDEIPMVKVDRGAVRCVRVGELELRGSLE
jgi:oligopeptide/dipeptide ABC transporter ATP-binding protein